MPKTGWLDKQMKKNSQEVEKWPRWMKKAAIKLDPPENKESNSKKRSCLNGKEEEVHATA